MSQSNTYQPTPEEIEIWKRIDVSEAPREARHLSMVLRRAFPRQNKMKKM